MRSIRTRPSAMEHRAERNAFCTFVERTPLWTLRRVLHSLALCNMKYGKYDLHKSSANLSIGTSYSWYYKKSDNPTTRRKKRLVRAASDSTLFSDYANQIPLFDKDKCGKTRKCKKSASDVSKNDRVKCSSRNIKPVHMEPFIGNFYYGKPLPGYEYSQKTEEKITYLPDSDIITVSEGNTNDTLTTAATIVDIPELVKNPIYGCLETDVQIPTPEYLTESMGSKDSQLKSTSCTELRNTMDSSTDPTEMLSIILKDYKRIMKEWNHTIADHYSTISHSKKGSTICRRSNTDSYIRSLHSTLSCRKTNKCLKNDNRHYKYPYASQNYKKSQSNYSTRRKTQSLGRHHTLNKWTSTLQRIKKKFLKSSNTLTSSECECLEAIYEDYDRRLQQWCDTVSQCSTYLSSIVCKIL